MATEPVSTTPRRRIRRPVPNMRSLPEKVACLKIGFTEQQKTWVENMGFGSIMEMDNLKLDRYLAFWLMERFDDRTAKLMLRENVELEVKANDVAWILGIPNNIAPIRLISKQDDRYLSLKSRYEALSMHDEKVCGIKETAVLSCIRSEIGYEEFKVHFLVYVLGTFLCPNQGNRISPRMLRVALNVGDPLEYDWASFVLDELLDARRKVREKRESMQEEGGRLRNEVQKRQYPTDYARGLCGGYGGCLMILVIFYLDRLKRRKVVGWGSKHGFRVRLSAWTKETMELAVQEDYDECNDEYGISNLLDDPDLRYGERHPDEAKGVLYKDIMFSERRSVFRHKVDPKMLKNPKRLRSINQVQMRQDADVGCSGSGRASDGAGGKGDEDEDDYVRDCMSGGVEYEHYHRNGTDSVNESRNVDEGIGSPADERFAKQLEDMLNGGACNDIRASVDNEEEDGNEKEVGGDVVLGFENHDSSVEHRRSTARSSRRANRNARTRLDWKILKFISLGGHARVEKEYIMVDIQSVIYVSRWELRTLAKPLEWLSSSVVSAWAILKNLDWQADNSSRFIFDPHYAIMAMEEGTGTFLMRCISTPVLQGCRKALSETGCTPANCRHVFFPICHDNHWWAMHFDMDEETIWELDSLVLDNREKIEKMLLNLQYLISFLVKDVDISSWRIMKGDVPIQKNGHDCGPVMMSILEVWPCSPGEDLDVQNKRRDFAVEMLKHGRNQIRERILLELS